MDRGQHIAGLESGDHTGKSVAFEQGAIGLRADHQRHMPRQQETVDANVHLHEREQGRDDPFMSGEDTVI